MGQALAGVDLIPHAGDVGGRAVLDALARVAAVSAVRGNVDVGGECGYLPERAVICTPGGDILVTHVFCPPGPAAGDDPTGARVVVFGHSHRQHHSEVDGVLYLNPASAGPRRFRNPRSVALLQVGCGQVEARFVSLD